MWLQMYHPDDSPDNFESQFRLCTYVCSYQFTCAFLPGDDTSSEGNGVDVLLGDMDDRSSHSDTSCGNLSVGENILPLQSAISSHLVLLVKVFRKEGNCCVFNISNQYLPSLVPRLSNRQAGGGGEPGISRILNAHQFQSRVAP